MAETKAGTLRKGMYISFKNQPHVITKTDFVSPGKGSAFVRAKLKNVVTGSVQEFTFKSHESVEELEVSSLEMQFLYADSSEVVFMNSRSYEQATVPRELVEDKIGLLTPEISCYILFYDDKALGVNLPPKVTLKVIEAQDAAAGNTVGQARKIVKLETGLEVSAPVFVKVGDSLIIDTDTMQYVSRG